jgi:hypothetical protein
LLEVVRWNVDDANTHDHLHMRVENRTKPNPTSSQVISAWTNFVKREALDGFS